MPRRGPRREYPLRHWWGAASIPPHTWPSPPWGAPSSAGLERGKGRGRGLGKRDSRERSQDGAGAGGAIRGLGTEGIGQDQALGLGLRREHTQELLSVSIARSCRQERPLLLAELQVGARKRLLVGTWRRSRLGLSWPFTRRRGVSMVQRRKWPDGGCRRRGRRRRRYATVCRARSKSHLLLGHRLAGSTGWRAWWERCRWCLGKRHGPFGRQ